jgi:hypothetical protein
MSSFLSALLKAALKGALATSAEASQNNLPIKQVGIVAGTGALLGLVSEIINHPSTPAPKDHAIEKALIINPPAQTTIDFTGDKI